MGYGQGVIIVVLIRTGPDPGSRERDVPISTARCFLGGTELCKLDKGLFMAACVQHAGYW